MRLFEFGDQTWLPDVLREAETAYLAASYRMLPLARVWADRIIAALQPRGSITILDLCSGAGGPIEQIVEDLQARGYSVAVTLSDRFPPSRTTAHPGVRWYPSPVNAMAVPPELAGIRTIFSAFHHFGPAAARAILEDAFVKRSPLCVFEGGSRSVAGVLAMLLVPLNVLFIMPRARPFRWQYLLFCYLIPILPVIIMWDGIVSMLRIYSTDEMKRMVAGLESPDYVWEIGALRVPRLPSALPYLIGHPTAEARVG